MELIGFMIVEILHSINNFNCSNITGEIINEIVIGIN